MKNLVNKVRTRANSDEGAAYSVEMLIGIALAVFAALALFTFVLKPVQSTADTTGKGIKDYAGKLFESQGKGTPTFDSSLGKDGVGE